MSELEKAVTNQKLEFGDAAFYDILSKAEKIPPVIEAFASKLKKCDASSETGYVARKPYSVEMKQFALTLYGYSRKSYDYVRETLQDSLPSVSTIKNWLNKVDGSPGFSNQALTQLSRMVQEQKMLGQEVKLQYKFIRGGGGSTPLPLKSMFFR